MDYNAIKKQILKKLQKDYPDTNISIEWTKIKSTKFPTGLIGYYAYGLVKGQGYNPRKYTLLITGNNWTFR
jgi:hypothetical protein